MANRGQFIASNVQFKYQNGTIVGTQSATIDCLCGHVWTAIEHRELNNLVGGGISVTCPACHACAITNPRITHAAP